MATSSSTPAQVGPETLITIKISVNGTQKKLKLPLADLVPGILPAKLRSFLEIPDHQAAVFERYSDSSGSYVNLHPSNLHAYKTLYRAAKAKLKLRLRATLGPIPNPPSSAILSNDTIDSLSMLKFGSEATLAATAGPSGSTGTASSSSSIKVEASESSTTSEADAPSDISTVASAIATLCDALDGTKIDVTNNEVKSSAKVVTPDVPSKLRSCPAFSLANPHFAEVRKSVPTIQASMSRCSAPPAPPAPEQFKSHPAFLPSSRSLAMRMSHPPTLPPGATFSWSVYCNECKQNMLDEHYHCSICEGGDYDLCASCVNNGKHCKDQKHWLIKRYLSDGKVINGTTTKVPPKAKLEVPKGMPGAFTEEKKVEEEPEPPTRTCNCCVRVFEEHAFVTCSDCEDYDLCVPCLENGKHGHHPAHTFYPATGLTPLTSNARALCKSGRNVAHAAICDACNNRIVGVRHKCLVCPDWDYCSSCIKKAPIVHRGHRFAAVYDSIAPQQFTPSPTHFSVFCDGPLCKTKNSYIAGIRYKCAVCPDVDFCASCEALPHLDHNKTHPLLKFRTPVRGCSITTLVGDENTRANNTEQVPTTHIRTVAEVKPTETKSLKEKIEIKDLLAEPIEEKVPVQETPEEKDTEVKTGELQAFFVRDTISDGTLFAPETQFTQVWTLKNPGPFAWPAGCSVRYVGGDNMLNVDDSRPSCHADFSKATESNIIRRPVQIGEEISFRVLMRAPKREGVAISYWRLKAADGTPFGHRLWCHINVTSPSSSSAPVEKDFTPREVGRLGNHENFIQYFLNEQAKQKKDSRTAIAELRAYAQKTQEARLASMRETLRLRMRSKAHQDMMKSRYKDSVNNDPLTYSPYKFKTEEVPKVEKTEPVEMPTEKSVVADKAATEEPAAIRAVQVVPTTTVVQEEQPVTNAAAAESVPAVAPAPVAVEEESELFEDAESVNLSSDEDSGFLTEEEYDILNASDEEAA